MVLRGLSGKVLKIRHLNFAFAPGPWYNSASGTCDVTLVYQDLGENESPKDKVFSRTKVGPDLFR